MKYAFANRMKFLQSSAVRDILKVVNASGVISFAGGLPADDLFPLEGIKESFNKAFQDGGKALQYIETEGYRPLREVLIERMKRKGIDSFTAHNVLLTTGSQQAIDLFSRVFFDAGDIILTEDPTYLSAIQVFSSYEAKIIGVDSDDEGMVLSDLEDKVKKHKPKCVYVVPTFSNPTGTVWTLERRQALLDLAKKHHFVIFEDDPYGDIQFSKEETYTPIAALDKEGTHVLYTSTFSKTAVPALRTGWIVGPEQVIRMMSQAKQANDLHSNSLSQQALYHLCTSFDLDLHIQNLIDVYRSRMEIMVGELDKANLPGLTYIKPKGGMFCWVELEGDVNTTELLPKVVEKGVAYVPGAPFYVGKPKQNTFRLNFTHSTPENLRKGMSILMSALHEQLGSKHVTS